MGGHEKEEAGPWVRELKAKGSRKLQREKRGPPTALWTPSGKEDKAQP